MASADELKAKLAAKIASMRSAREPKTPRDPANVAPVKSKAKKPAKIAAKQLKKVEKPKETAIPAVKKTIVKAGTISFGRLKLGEEVDTRLRQVAPGTKKKRLQTWLNDAQKTKRSLEQVKETEGVEAAKEKEKNLKLANAVKKAKGERVGGLDVGKIKKSMKQINKKKEKSAKFWDDKNQTEQEAKTQRLAKREENINKFKKRMNTPVPAVTTENVETKEADKSKLTRKQRANQARMRAKAKETRDKKKKQSAESTQTK